MAMELRAHNGGFELLIAGRTVLRHTAAQPLLFAGRGDPEIEMYRGNFEIRDHLDSRIPLSACALRDGAVQLSAPGGPSCELTFSERDGRVAVHAVCSGGGNRLWLRLPAAPEDSVFGGGEQFSCFDLRGRRFEIFTREQGVGRNKREYVTFLADQERAGGDYDWTFFPQPTFFTTAGWFFHLEDNCYSALDFTRGGFHEIEIWSDCFTAVLGAGDSLKALVSSFSDYIGRQPPLPDWAYRGVWLGIQGGSAVVEQKLAAMRAAGTDVTGIWCQDWQGVRYTSFGKRLMWNWKADEDLYPHLAADIIRWRESGAHFMGYINPYVCEERDLFAEAREKGLLALNRDGEVYRVDFGEFCCGIVDFTNPAAFDWYKQVIKNHLLDIGLDGWMADFDEYLPTDCVLADGEDPIAAHNRWPMLWAKLNYEVLEETGNLGKKAVFFRAGAAGTQRYAPLLWAGDQNVDWSVDDGPASVVVAALSAGLCGCGLHTSDCGGYTTLYHMKRTKELLLRWLELCAFTPVLRTHEGNRPDSNWQFDSDDETRAAFARFSRLHTALAPYTEALAEEYRRTGLPVMRPLFLEYPEDPVTRALDRQYLLGADLLVAPVFTEGADTVSLYLPAGRWHSLWDDRAAPNGRFTAPAPLGRPAVFRREGSPFTSLFVGLKDYLQ